MSAVLLCSVELNHNQPALTFEWISGGNIQPGKELTILLGGELDEQQYTCRVSNPVSYETSTFIAKDCNTGRISPRSRLHRVKQWESKAPKSESCMRDVCASVSDPGVSAGGIVVIVVIISVGVALLVFCFIKFPRGEQYRRNPNSHLLVVKLLFFFFLFLKCLKHNMFHIAVTLGKTREQLELRIIC